MVKLIHGETDLLIHPLSINHHPSSGHHLYLGGCGLQELQSPISNLLSWPWKGALLIRRRHYLEVQPGQPVKSQVYWNSKGCAAAMHNFQCFFLTLHQQRPFWESTNAAAGSRRLWPSRISALSFYTRKKLKRAEIARDKHEYHGHGTSRGNNKLAWFSGCGKATRTW